MSALTSLLMTAGGLVLLIVGAELLIRGASSLAKRLAIAEIVIGLTVVAFGTSTPEMVVNVFASAEGRNEIVFGNIIGSNIFNILFVTGVSAAIYPIASSDTIWINLALMLTASVMFLIMAKRSSRISRPEGVILLVFYAAFLILAVLTS